MTVQTSVWLAQMNVRFYSKRKKTTELSTLLAVSWWLAAADYAGLDMLNVKMSQTASSDVWQSRLEGIRHTAHPGGIAHAGTLVLGLYLMGLTVPHGTIPHGTDCTSWDYTSWDWLYLMGLTVRHGIDCTSRDWLYLIGLYLTGLTVRHGIDCTSRDWLYLTGLPGGTVSRKMWRVLFVWKGCWGQRSTETEIQKGVWPTLAELENSR